VAESALTRVELRTYLICPNCGKNVSTIDHLLDQPKFQSRWVCKHCGVSVSFRMEYGKVVETSVATGEHWVKGVAVLKLDPQDHPIYFAIDHLDYRPSRPEDDTERDESRRFLFESHSCPTNWLKPILVVDGDDTDPHGLLKYVLWREMDVSDRSSAQDDRVAELVKEAQRG